MTRARIRWAGTPVASYLSDVEVSGMFPRFRIVENDDGTWELHDRGLWQRSDFGTLSQARMAAEAIVAEER